MTKLTKAQRAYLSAMLGHSLSSGWGGHSSTLTVRILEERGLCTLRQYGPGDWVASITGAGRDALEGSNSNSE